MMFSIRTNDKYTIISSRNLCQETQERTEKQKEYLHLKLLMMRRVLGRMRTQWHESRWKKMKKINATIYIEGSKVGLVMVCSFVCFIERNKEMVAILRCISSNTDVWRVQVCAFGIFGRETERTVGGVSGSWHKRKGKWGKDEDDKEKERDHPILQID